MAVMASADLGEKLPERVTLFYELLRPGVVGGRPTPSVDDLVEEALTIIGAGSETTGDTLDLIAYYVLSNGEIYNKLTAELEESFPDPTITLDFVTLEKLPYLVRPVQSTLYHRLTDLWQTAVIKEGLR